MKIIKQLDKLVVKGFIGPYLISFLVAEFVLVLQFIWQRIDDFIGKGVSISVLMEMVFFYSLTIIPLALPISILISSVMVYGNLSEKYELTSFKSAGVSMLRILRPAIFIGLLTGFFSIFASNYLKPNAFLSFAKIFDNVKRAKPTLTIDKGIFNYDFKGYAIRVGDKDPDGQGISDILIYDQTDRRLLGLITAKSGKMYTSANGQFFTMELYDGIQYAEIERKGTNSKKDKGQFSRTYFEKYIKQFDMSGFEFTLSSDPLSSRKHDLYNSFQMQEIIDSLGIKIDDKIESAKFNYSELVDIYVEEETTKLDKSTIDILDRETERINNEAEEKSSAGNDDKKPDKQREFNNKNQQSSRSNKFYEERISFRKDTFNLDTITSIANTIKDAQLRNIIFRAKAQAQTLKEKYRGIKASTKSIEYNRNKFRLKLHQQFCWAVICVLFVFIGAPLGSVVRKGGFGYPLLIAIVFFVVFIFSNILGEKLTSSGTVNPVLGSWLPCLVIIPFSIYFTYKALQDSTFNINIKSLFS